MLPARDLFKGAALRSILWSVLGSLTLCVQLANFFLIADLFDLRGKLNLPGTSAAVVESLETGTALADGTTTESVRREDLGVLPSVYWARNKYWGRALFVLYRRIDWLQSDSSALIFLVVAAVVAGVVRQVAIARAKRVSGNVGLDAATRLRRTLHRQAMRLGPEDLADQERQHVLTLFTDEVDRVKEGVATWLYRVGRYPLELLLLLGVAFSINAWSTLQCVIPLGFCWFLLMRERRQFESGQHRADVLVGEELRLLAESFRKTRIVRGYGMEALEHDRFQNYLDRFRSRLSAAGRGSQLSWWAIRIFVIVSVAIVLYLVGSKVLTTPAELSPAAALTLLATLAAMLFPLDALNRLAQDRENASLAAERVFRYLNRVPEVSQAVGAKFLQPLSQSLRFEQVTCNIPNRKSVLNSLDLTIPAGSVTALISLDPLEARCLAYLLPRFVEPSAGRVLIDGEDIAWVTLESLRAEVVYVGGTDPFFTGTVLENISCGNKNYSLPQVTEAAKRAHAHNFILKLAQGFETMLGEHGETLDAGQAFRLGLARAILRNPALMIIEEPLAPLETDVKDLLDDAYSYICTGRTVIFLPARLSTLRRADQVVLVHEGKVQATGDYATLVKKSQLYRHWEYIRFNEYRPAVEAAAASGPV